MAKPLAFNRLGWFILETSMHRQTAKLRVDKTCHKVLISCRFSVQVLAEFAAKNKKGHGLRHALLLAHTLPQVLAESECY